MDEGMDLFEVRVSIPIHVSPSAPTFPRPPGVCTLSPSWHSDWTVLDYHQARGLPSRTLADRMRGTRSRHGEAWWISVSMVPSHPSPPPTTTNIRRILKSWGTRDLDEPCSPIEPYSVTDMGPSQRAKAWSTSGSAGHRNASPGVDANELK